MSRGLPVAYTIKRKGGSLDIALVEADRLLLHEETIPEMLQELVDKIRADGKLRAPVIVDRETLVVLDGMHRVEALRRLGCRFVCACLVDYKSPDIEVDRWCRTVSRPFDSRNASGLAEKLGFKLSPIRHRRSAEDAGPPFIIFRNSSYALIAPCSDIRSSFVAVRELETSLRARGNRIGYETERNAVSMLESGSVDAVICPPTIGKEEVIESATGGRVFIFKATRHVIPARPLEVNVPLSLLQDSVISVLEANERLSEMLRGRRLRHLQPGSVWNGRLYEEDLYIFEAD